MPAGPSTGEARRRRWRARVAAPYQPGSTECAGSRSIHQILRRPSVEVVLRHARLGEPLPAVVLSGSEGAEQGVAPDFLVAARVVDLVQLVAAAELRPDRVPQELHQLDPLHSVDTAGAS